MKLWFSAGIALVTAIVTFRFFMSNQSEPNPEPSTSMPYKEEEILHEAEVKVVESKETVTLTLMPFEEASNSLSQDASIKQLEASLQSGSYTILDDGYVSYSAGSRIKVPNGPTISNETGVLFSDIEMRSFAGDLLIGSYGTPHSHRGILEIKEGGTGFALITLEEDVENELGRKASNQSVGEKNHGKLHFPP